MKLLLGAGKEAWVAAELIVSGMVPLQLQLQLWQYERTACDSHTRGVLYRI